MAPKKIALILSSTRTVRIGPAVVSFLQKLFSTSTASPKPELSIVDVANFDLPVFNEKPLPQMVPAMAQFEHAHSKAWSEAIAPFDGYVFISPEYNFGVPGGVKNAIDYLYNEWIGKPIFIVTYGIQGAKHASESLKTILEGMKLRVVPTRPNLKFAGLPAMDEVYAAAAGSLGEKTLKEWEESEEVKKELLDGFGELVAKLEEPAAAPVNST
jgi:NAD(P)H-dependent FMN reductase